MLQSPPPLAKVSKLTDHHNDAVFGQNCKVVLNSQGLAIATLQLPGGADKYSLLILFLHTMQKAFLEELVPPSQEPVTGHYLGRAQAPNNETGMPVVSSHTTAITGTPHLLWMRPSAHSRNLMSHLLWACPVVTKSRDQHL